jgi:hypothetical protein
MHLLALMKESEIANAAAATQPAVHADTTTHHQEILPPSDNLDDEQSRLLSILNGSQSAAPQMSQAAQAALEDQEAILSMLDKSAGQHAGFPSVLPPQAARETIARARPLSTANMMAGLGPDTLMQQLIALQMSQVQQQMQQLEAAQAAEAQQAMQAMQMQQQQALQLQMQLMSMIGSQSPGMVPAATGVPNSTQFAQAQELQMQMMAMLGQQPQFMMPQTQAPPQSTMTNLPQTPTSNNNIMETTFKFDDVPN